VSVTSGQIDVATIRAAFPIEQVVHQAGVQLHPSGRGFMGCCPFHEDATPSLSVGGVPDRFTCFGCGAHGDVIDFVQRLHGLSFVEAVRSLTTAAATPSRALAPRIVPGPGIPARRLTLAPNLSVSDTRGYEINRLAWEHLSSPVAVSFADSYLRCHRGIDLRPLRAQNPGVPLVGHAGHGWSSLTDRLRSDGVADEELLAMDLARPTRAGRLVDSLRDRLILAVTDRDGRIRGFIGRDLSDDPRAPKYLNPTRTATFDKAAVLYRPIHHELSATANVVVVEGVLDAIAIAAAAARAGRSAEFAPCTTSGVAVTSAQAAQVIDLAAGRPPVIAMDGDEAGAEGSLRWLTRICLERHTPALVTRLPIDVDPADWVREHGLGGLTAFDTSHARATATAVAVGAPGRELARMAIARGGDRVARAPRILVSLAADLPRPWATQQLDQAEREMTRQGWNPDGQFTSALRQAIASAGLTAPDRDRSAAAGAVYRTGPGAIPLL